MDFHLAEGEQEGPYLSNSSNYYEKYQLFITLDETSLFKKDLSMKPSFAEVKAAKVNFQVPRDRLG